MKSKELYNWIESCVQDIDFEYNGKLGSICPFNRANIALCYDGYAVDVHSVEEAMQIPFIDGKSLAQLCENPDFDI